MTWVKPFQGKGTSNSRRLLAQDPEIRVLWRKSREHLLHGSSKEVAGAQ